MPQSSTPMWVSQLLTSIHSLKAASARARTAYEHADALAIQTLGEASRANETQDIALFAATVQYNGYARSHYAGVLDEISGAHLGLTMSLARVWCRAAHPYAYGVSTALREVAQGKNPSTAEMSYADLPKRPNTKDQDVLRTYQAALDAHTAMTMTRGSQGADPWATSAAAWHDFADQAERLLWQQVKATATAR
ncbi:hypothetical protein [Streptomyces sp. NPDC037389]|uniref:hypothetical protein n=1 Tax=Streptomyces sp. NPDC037389 TaxID=3155369 RepID=UPI0033C975A5